MGAIYEHREENRSTRPNQSRSSFSDGTGSCACLGSGGESEHCSLNTKILALPSLNATFPPPPAWYSSLRLSVQTHSHLIPPIFVSGTAAPVSLSFLSTVQSVLQAERTTAAELKLLTAVRALTRRVVAEWGWGLCGGGNHCCLHVESLRILLAVETPLREGLDEEEDLRSALVLLFRDPPSLPFTQTGLSSAGLLSAFPWSSSATCSKVQQKKKISGPRQFYHTSTQVLSWPLFHLPSVR